MSLAWATVVVAILLTPGAFFFAGLYAPQAVSRETVSISPLGQLAGIVCTSFFLHGIFYLLINDVLVKLCPWSVPIDLGNFFPILHADAEPLRDGKFAGTELRLHILHVVLYFAAIDTVGWMIGFAFGWAIENQLPFFKRLARHPWLYEIRGPARGNRGGRAKTDRPEFETIIYVSALSKVQQDGQIILYEGQLSNIYVKADGAISYMTLARASSSILALPSRPKVSDSDDGQGRAFMPETMRRGPEWSLQQSLNLHKSQRHKSDMLFLSGTEVSNFYLERRVLAEKAKLTSTRLNTLLQQYQQKYQDLSHAEQNAEQPPENAEKS